MHNDHVFPAGQYSPRTVPTPGRLARIDQLTSESVNAANGGDWAPAKRINIGGSGVELSTATATLSGEVRTDRDAVGLVCMANEYPAFEVPRAKTVVLGLFNSPAFGANLAPLWGQSTNPWGLIDLQGTVAQIIIPLPSLRMHNGATIVSARLSHRYGRQVPTADILAGRAVYFRLMRLPKDAIYSTLPNLVELYVIPTFVGLNPYNVGDVIRPTAFNTRQYRCTVAGTTAASSAGWSTTIGNTQVSGSASFRVEPGPSAAYGNYAINPTSAAADPAAMFNSGLPYDITLPINLNPTIDTSTYTYAVEIIDPGGNSDGNFNNIFHSVSIDLVSIVDMSPP
jgi:hypothetical protein